MSHQRNRTLLWMWLAAALFSRLAAAPADDASTLADQGLRQAFLGFAAALREHDWPQVSAMVDDALAADLGSQSFTDLLNPDWDPKTLAVEFARLYEFPDDNVTVAVVSVSRSYKGKTIESQIMHWIRRGEKWFFLDFVFAEAHVPVSHAFMNRSMVDVVRFNHGATSR